MFKEENIAKIFKALGHPLRIKIVKYLLDGEKCVCELNQLVEYSQPNLSQHLKILKDAGIVEANKKGFNIYYRIKNELVKSLIESAQELAAANLKAFVEE